MPQDLKKRAPVRGQDGNSTVASAVYSFFLTCQVTPPLIADVCLSISGYYYPCMRLGLAFEVLLGFLTCRCSDTSWAPWTRSSTPAVSSVVRRRSQAAAAPVSARQRCVPAPTSKSSAMSARRPSRTAPTRFRGTSATTRPPSSRFWRPLVRCDAPAAGNDLLVAHAPSPIPG